MAALNVQPTWAAVIDERAGLRADYRIYGPKFDGFRGLLYVSHGECHVSSKRSNLLKRHRSEAVEYRVEQHFERIGDQLKRIGFVITSVINPDEQAAKEAPLTPK